MRHGKLKAGLVLGLVVVVAVASFTAYRLVKKTFGNAHSAFGPKESAPSKNKQVALLPIASPPLVLRGEAMAQAFRGGRLPAPLPQPEGAPEQAAAELATRVMAENDQSTAALLTALQMSGFSVRGDDGLLAFESVKPGQGIVIDAWEVAALAKLFGDGMQVRLGDFSNAFASTVPPLKDAPVATLFLDGLRAAAQGDQPTMRFWADFIAELGRQSAKPYDLLAPDVDPGKVDLDAIQVSLILRRLLADFMLLDRNKSQKAQWAPVWSRERTSAQWEPASYNFEGGASRYIRDAVWRPEDGPSLLLVQEGGGSSLPCTLKELEAQILDGTAYSFAKGFDKMLEYLGKHEMEGAEKYSGATSAANAVLALIKLWAYYACMETDITMSGNPPLVRTQKTTEAGEERTLTATVRENIGKWQALNCARLALNGANLDISLPNDGPVAGVKTQWVLTSGAVSISGGAITYPIVELVFPDGTPLVQNAMGPISDASAPKTDEEGHTKIDIEGVKQREPLINPLPVMKQAAVRFTVAAKPVTMSQDLIDAVGVGVVGGVGLGFAGPVEMLLRSNIYFSKQLNIPVKDWDSCDGGWGGTITYERTWHWVHNDPVQNMTEARDQTSREVITLRGDPNGATGWNGKSHGTFAANFDGKYLGVNRWPANRFSGACTLTAEETTPAAGGGETDLGISFQGDNKYLIGPTSATLPGADTWRRTSSGDCKGKALPDTSNPLSYSMEFAGVTVQEDPNQPGVLRGSASLPGTMSGETITATWNLTQCPGRR
jgi:hypothetical protein